MRGSSVFTFIFLWLPYMYSFTKSGHHKIWFISFDTSFIHQEKQMFFRQIIVINVSSWYSIKRLSWVRRGRREWSFCARIFLVLVIFSDFISAVLIGDVCSPELMKVFKTLFPKLQNGHVVSACACAAWHVCVTAFSIRTCVLQTDLTVPSHVSFLYSILHLARAKSEALVNICSFSNKTAK